ncbi:MAG: hypothetical protein GX275_04070 [Clostridiales bacterium]|nr:hypothetical protein [Clostridiales bacterium]
MKKVRIILISIFILIPTYFIFLWEPDEITKTTFKLDSMLNVDRELSKEEKLTNAETKEKYLSISELENKISNDNKDKYKKLLLDLSIIDYEKILVLSKSKNTDESTEEYIRLLRKRLSNDKFIEIKEILMPYINVDDIK